MVYGVYVWYQTLLCASLFSRVYLSCMLLNVMEYLAVSAAEAIWWHLPLSNPWLEPMSTEVMPVCHVSFGASG